MLVAEKEAENVRLAGMIPRAHRRRGTPYAADDYRRRDVPVLELRQRVNAGLIERLRALAGDEDWMRRQVQEAREAALMEIVHPRLDPPPPALDDLYWSERDDRIARLALDLAELASESG
ncbi:hypothetical protein [Naasia aerilata]|uniref:TnpV protein n=1 Tax=Naasia aerilata TaxID=1162966 RepID=A0ABM8G8U7_9MICO|nr:hypothetical protein [Naasia aerilata]BDZ44525.1 hypothetical protein GCM10025866_04340 [Naasia aerilata]